MQAERVILETDLSGNLKQIPKLPANKQFEVIFLEIDDISPQSGKRSPHPDILGKIDIKGDVFNSTPNADWDFS